MLRRYRIPLLLVVIALAAVYLFGFRWRAGEQVARHHARLVESIEAKKWNRCLDLISADYGDRWGFDRRELGLALKDVGSQFVIALDMNWQTDRTEAVEAGRHYAVTGRGRITGTGTALASAIEQQAARYAGEPFTFHWKRQSWAPWDWKLTKVEHPTLSIPAGYEPGDLSRAVDGF